MKTIVFLITILVLVSSGCTSSKEYVSRGDEKYKNRDYAGAVVEYTNAIEADPKCVAAYTNRAGIKKKLNDNKGAIADYCKLIELQPKEGVWYYERGRLFIDQGEQKDGCLDLTKAGELGVDVSETIKILCR